jgi:branched-chain amino acid transport system permease protein
MAETYAPLQASLLWFTAVVVFGADSAAGAVIAAGFIVTLDNLAPPGSSILAIGILALALGWMPGGLAAAVRGGVRWLAQTLADEFVQPHQQRPRPRPLLAIPPTSPPAAAIGGMAPAGQPAVKLNGVGSHSQASAATGRAGAPLAPRATVTAASSATGSSATGLRATPYGQALIYWVHARQAQAAKAAAAGAGPPAANQPGGPNWPGSAQSGTGQPGGRQ